MHKTENEKGNEKKMIKNIISNKKKVKNWNRKIMLYNVIYFEGVKSPEKYIISKLPTHFPTTFP